MFHSPGLHRRLNRCSTIIVALILPLAAAAQHNIAWKKLVTREVLVPEGPAKNQVRGAGAANLIDLVLRNLRAGKLAVYANSDLPPVRKLSDAEVKDIIDTKYDTIIVTDPVNGKEMTKIRKTEFDTKNIRKYRLLEEWQYSPATGHGDVRILSLAPVRDIYTTDGVFRGMQAVFWMRYEDIAGLLMEGNQAMLARIWSDYFNPVKAGVGHLAWSTYTSRNMDLGSNIPGLRFKDVSPDTTLLEYLENGIRAGHVNLYPDGDIHCTSQVGSNQRQVFIGSWVDTQMIMDPVSGNQVRKVMVHDTHSEYADMQQQYRVVDKWDFDREHGTISIQVECLAPLGENDRHAMVPRYWLRYADMAGILAGYDKLHPRNSLNWKIWDSYLSSRERPEVVK